MSIFVFNSNPTSVEFTTTGATGAGGGAAMMGAFWLGNLYTSYYANGSHNCYLGVTRGLVNNSKYGYADVSATAGATVTDQTAALRLATQGVTGTFQAEFTHPDGVWASNSFGVVFPYTTLVVMKISNGIIYGISSRQGVWTLSQWGEMLWPAYSAANNVENTQTGPVVSADGTSVCANAAAISGSFYLYTVYDIRFWDVWWGPPNQCGITIFYTRWVLTLSGGLVQSYIGNSYTLNFYVPWYNAPF